MQDTSYTLIDPRSGESKTITAPDWPTACRESGITDACVMFNEADGRVTALFIADDGLPFGVTAWTGERALAGVVEHQDRCRTNHDRIAKAWDGLLDHIRREGH